MNRGRLPVLTESQREELRDVVLARRACKRELAGVIQQIRELQRQATRIRVKRAGLPTNKEMAAKYGIVAQSIHRIANHAYRNLNPLDAKGGE